MKPILKQAETVFDMLVKAIKDGVAPDDHLKQVFVDSIEAAFEETMALEPHAVKETHISLKGGDWRVRRRGDDLIIVDGQGRQRHASRGHDMTAVHLAMQLAERPFLSEPNLDEGLRRLAERWGKGAPDEPTENIH